MIEFAVHGAPITQGNHRVSRSGYMYDAAGAALRDWRSQVAWCARLAARSTKLEGAVSVELDFRIARPKRPRSTRPITRPDVDKLVRALLDALTSAGVWNDDGQVVRLLATKVYAEAPGVTVRIAQIEEEPV